MFTSALLYCRPGFENECAAEIQLRLQVHSIEGFCKTKPLSGFVVFAIHDFSQGRKFFNCLKYQELIFTRQIVWLGKLVTGLPDTDRVTPLLEAIEQSIIPCLETRDYSELLVETADTNEAKELLTFARKFTVPMRAGLKKAGFLERRNTLEDPRIHVFFQGASMAYVGVSFPENSSEWFMGIPRFRFPAGAPSRSTLKLEEAFHTFMTPSERDLSLCEGKVAVDLGAAPGGWTFQFMKRNIYTYAIDNGPLAAELLSSGMVEHLRVDGFTYEPRKAVDWMVCDMVEQPIRIAKLVCLWAERGWAQQFVFNLKLPMKKRLDEVERCLDGIRDFVERLGIPYELRCKQLYHDREEVTAYLKLERMSE
jgi:23S rRNA (cytidine2498-2'-O)-methyltransferase